MCKPTKYLSKFHISAQYFARKRVVFWKNLHSWKNFNTTTSRDGHDKFQVWRCSTYPKNDNPTPKLKFWIFNYLGRVNLPKNNEYLGRVYWRLYMEINIIELTTSNRPAKGLKRSHSEVSHLILTRNIHHFIT